MRVDSKGRSTILEAFKKGKDFSIYFEQTNVKSYNYLVTVEVSNFNELYAECMSD